VDHNELTKNHPSFGQSIELTFISRIDLEVHETSYIHDTYIHTSFMHIMHIYHNAMIAILFIKDSV
jgi:hypothetical protein